MPAVTASAKSKTYSSPGIHISENFLATIQAGLDDVMKRDFVRPSQGSKYFNVMTSSKNTHKWQSWYGLATVGQNRDAEKLAYDTQGEGFGYEVTPVTYRGAVQIEKELVEDELYGAISDLQSNLAESARTSVELIMSDVFNRGLGDGGAGAPFVCEDGMYFIDSARPNANTRAGTWSNLDASGAITATSLFTTELAFRSNKDERAQLAPLKMESIIIRPNEEVGLWEILKSDLRPSDAMNAKNFSKGRYQYEVYDYLTSARAYYRASNAKNELQFVWRKKPEIKTWVDGSNPDLTHQRVRMRLGIGCGRPHMWRGQIIS